jgi:hypothetical protein
MINHPSKSSSSSLSATFSFLVLALVFVTGLLLGFVISSYSNNNNLQQNQQELTTKIPEQQRKISRELQCPSSVSPPPPRGDENENEEKDQTENSLTANSNSCIPFMSDLKKSFLTKLDDPNSPISIIRGGTTTKETNPKSTSKNSPRSFREIGDSMKDDKTLSHRFDQEYEAYLGAPHIRENSHLLSMFEVGLGCNQHLGVGASAKLWGEFLPNARLAMLEFDEKCAKEWPMQEENKKLVPKGGFVVYSGDQANPKTWKEVLEKEDEGIVIIDNDHENNNNDRRRNKKSIRMYDVVIDDGGHSMEQQIQTFLSLWGRVKPGGIYVIEDLNTSWKTRYQGTKRMLGTSKTTNNLVKALMDRVHSVPLSATKSDEDLKKASGIHRVDCMHFICFISKRWAE